jgi:hypothetical protein
LALELWNEYLVTLIRKETTLVFAEADRVRPAPVDILTRCGRRVPRDINLDVSVLERYKRQVLAVKKEPERLECGSLRTL